MSVGKCQRRIAIGIVLLETLGLVVIVESLREVASVPDVDERMRALALCIDRAPTDDVNGSNILEVGAQWVYLKVVFPSGPRKRGISKFCHCHSSFLREGQRYTTGCGAMTC